MVCGAISSQGVGPLHESKGSMNSVTYQDILAKSISPYV